MKKPILFLVFSAVALVVGLLITFSPRSRPIPRILVFSKTAGYHHASIDAGNEALLKLAAENGFDADTTSDSRLFSDEILSTYRAVVFLSTTQDVLNEFEQIALQRFIEAGGGYVGIHAASDTEYDWPWYGQLVGGYFMNHSAIQEATLHVRDASHASTRLLPEEWIRTDEWYNIRTVNDNVHIVLSIDESTYDTGAAGGAKPHPMAWYHEFDGGRAFYTALGHTEESYSDSLFLAHIWGGISWSVGDVDGLDYTRDRVVPDPADFRLTVLEENLNEPMELDLLPDGRILYAERRGEIRLFEPATGQTTVAAVLDVFSDLENGVLGLAVDPLFSSNAWVYLYYSPAGEDDVQNLSRFKFRGAALDISSEEIILQVRNQRLECCHSGGSVEFGPGGLLFLSVGDDTNPFASAGFSPLDQRPGRASWDAERTSANTQDLRGKILRIRPEADGSYSIPDGNLFPRDGSAGRPEIYIMGDRNPFRISIDQKNGTLYWGEVGPDASRDSLNRGPKGYDEINRATEAGFYGWPYFIADNKAYHEFDFEKSVSGVAFDASAPVNESPHNSGLRDLPPAQPAFIWYPYDTSMEFPMMGEGGRTAMAGPVYRGTVSESYSSTSNRQGAFPAYYKGKLFIYEWMRHYVKVVTMNDDGTYRYMESFLPGAKWSRPVDMIFSKDGVLYLLEYGSAWNARNIDARLVRVEYIPG